MLLSVLPPITYGMKQVVYFSQLDDPHYWCKEACTNLYIYIIIHVRQDANPSMFVYDKYISIGLYLKCTFRK